MLFFRSVCFRSNLECVIYVFFNYPANSPLPQTRHSGDEKYSNQAKKHRTPPPASRLDNGPVTNPETVKAISAGFTGKRGNREAVNTWSGKARDARKDKESKAKPTEEALKRDKETADTPNPSRPASPKSSPSTIESIAAKFTGPARPTGHTETKEKAKEIFGAAKKLSANVAAKVNGAEKGPPEKGAEKGPPEKGAGKEKGPPEMPMIPKRATGDAKKRTVTFGWNKGGKDEVDEVYMRFNCGYVQCTKKTVKIDAKLGVFTVDGIDTDAYVEV